MKGASTMTKKNKATKLDATEHLMSTPANEKALDESIAELEAGKGIRISLEDLFSAEEYSKSIEK
ncbi:hypothetical protein [Mucilaginibacter sp.]|uniref:hypothetical protein n=2 Tax=Mucilaginibacter sp. TaxID=1882438 RepID=UPI0032662FF5